MNIDLAAGRGADAIHGAFDRYHELFRRLTRKAQERFEARDWAGIRRLTTERLDLHPKIAARTFERLTQDLGQQTGDHALWAAMKTAYTHSILGRDDFEIAQTFFNSLTRRAFSHVGVDPAIDYVADDFPLPYKGWEMSSARLYAVRRVDAAVIARVLENTGFKVPFRALEEDARLAAERLESGLVAAFGSAEVDGFETLRPVFLRNKAAYVIGRVRRGERVLPVVLALLNGREGLRVDAVLTTEDETSTVLSFARWYFHADVPNPREVIGFLQSILPRKRISELYLAIGYDKHGKTEFYRDLMTQIAAVPEQFVVAPGQPGQVMAVFTLPSYEFVFKIIKDVFPPTKHTNRREILARYREVQRHDRVGRLVDFQEFEHLSFPAARFSPELLEQLLRVAGKTVWLRGSEVVIDHVYVGRRVVPLDLFVRDAPAAEVAAAVVDWGQALRDLAAANIFIGDILPKNFGVTRHGRVVAYDYDELRPLVACNFRRFPQARNDFDALSDQPWFGVAADDVFPEELHSFLGLRGRLFELFHQHHAELFDVELWRAMQEQNRRGEIIDFFPYGEASRLRTEKAEPELLLSAG